MEYEPKLHELFIARILNFFGFHKTAAKWEFRYEVRNDPEANE